MVVKIGNEGRSMSLHLLIVIDRKPLTIQAKADGFLPGGASLHSCMTPHGPDTKTYEVTHVTT